MITQPPDAFFIRLASRCDGQLGLFWCLVGGIDAGELKQLTDPCPAVASFRIARFAHIQIGGDMNFMEPPVF